MLQTGHASVFVFCQIFPSSDHSVRIYVISISLIVVLTTAVTTWQVSLSMCGTLHFSNKKITKFWQVFIKRSMSAKYIQITGGSVFVKFSYVTTATNGIQEIAKLNVIMRKVVAAFRFLLLVTKVVFWAGKWTVNAAIWREWYLAIRYNRMWDMVQTLSGTRTIKAT